MYESNGNKAGFFVKRDSWDKTYAKVLMIGAQPEGPLGGTPPYFGNPNVLASFYGPDGTPSGKPEFLRSPGTFGYSLFEPPDE